MHTSEVGILNGRFQILHLGYVEYILAAKMRCRRLVIGIGNPDEQHLQYNRLQPGSIRKRMNPFTYYERMQMIHAAMKDFGISREDYEIVPFPLDTPELLENYIPREGTCYMNLLDQWSDGKRRELEELGYRVEALRTGTSQEKKMTSASVLETMGTDGEWEKLVPRSVASYIKENGLDERVRTLWNLPVLENEEETD